MSTINRQFLEFLVREQLQTDPSLTDLTNQVQPLKAEAMGYSTYDSGGGPSVQYPEIDADADEVWSVLDTAMLTLDIMAVVAAIATGGYAGIAYVGARQALKVALRALIRRGASRISAKRIIVRLAKITARKANPKIIRKRIADSLAKSKIRTAWKAAKYYMVGSAIIHWKDSLEVIGIAHDHYKAMEEQKKAAYVSGNKARVAVASNTIPWGKADYFLKTFFTLYTQYQAYDVAMKEQEHLDAGVGGVYDKNQDPRLWKVDDQIISMFTDDEIVQTFNAGLDPASWSESIVNDTYNMNSKTLKFFRVTDENKENIVSKYYDVYLHIKSSSTTALGVLSEYLGEAVPLESLMVSDQTAKYYAKFWAHLFSTKLRQGKVENLGIAHPQYFALWCIRFFSDGFKSAELLDGPAVDASLENKIQSELLIDLGFNLFERFKAPLLDGENRPFDIGNFHEEKEETDDGPYSQNVYDIESEKQYDDIPAGVTARDSTGVELTHRAGSAWSRSPNMVEDVSLKVGNIFSGKEQTLKKVFAVLQEEIFEIQIENSFAGKEKEFYEAFYNFALTITLDPSGKGFGGYEKVKECRKWLEGDAQAGFEEIVGETGMGKQLLGAMMFYYGEVYVLNKPFAALWTKLIGQRKKIPKSLKIGTWQNTALVISSFVALAFLDPLNKLDKRRMIDILLKAKKLAHGFAVEHNGGEVDGGKCQLASTSQDSQPVSPVAGPSSSSKVQMLDALQEKLHEGDDPPRKAKWAFTEDQNTAVVQSMWSSMAELEKEVNQTISQIFEWSNQVQERQKSDKQAGKGEGMQIPGGSEECEIFLTRAAVKEQLNGLQSELGMTIRDMTKDNYGFKIDELSYGQFNCFIDEAIEKMSGLFDAIKQADISPLTGDHTLEEVKKTDYLENYILENKHLLKTFRKNVDNNTPINESGGNSYDLPAYMKFLQEKRGLKPGDAWMICKILDFIGYRNITKAESDSEQTEWNLWKNDVNTLKTKLDIEESTILSRMRADYRKFRRNNLQPVDSSHNSAYWNDSADHLHGAVLKGESRGFYHLRSAGTQKVNSYFILGATRLYGFDNLYLQSNLVGSALMDVEESWFNDMRTRNYGGINPLRLDPDYFSKKEHVAHVLSGGNLSGLKKNRNIKESNLGQLNDGMNLTAADAGVTEHSVMRNVLVVASEFVRDYDKSGYVDLESSVIKDKLLNIKSNLGSLTTGAHDVKETNQVETIIDICSIAAAQFSEWEQSIKTMKSLGDDLKNRNLHGGFIGNFENFLNANYSKKKKGLKFSLESLSTRWYEQEKSKIINEQDRLDTYLLHMAKLILIDEKIASIN